MISSSLEKFSMSDFSFDLFISNSEAPQCTLHIQHKKKKSVRIFLTGDDPDKIFDEATRFFENYEAYVADSPACHHP